MIPYLGTQMKTNRMRIPRPMELWKKVDVVFPSPFRTLVKVVVKYRNGHIQHRIMIKVPANSLPKIILPMEGPNNRNEPVQRMPNIKQYLIVFSIV